MPVLKTTHIIQLPHVSGACFLEKLFRFLSIVTARSFPNVFSEFTEMAKKFVMCEYELFPLNHKYFVLICKTVPLQGMLYSLLLPFRN